MKRLIVSTIVLGACGKAAPPPPPVYLLNLALEGVPPGALIKLGDSEVGITVPGLGLDKNISVHGQIKGLDFATGDAKLKTEKLTAQFLTPCGPVSVALEVDRSAGYAKGAKVADADREKVPSVTIVYTEGPIGSLQLGKVTPGAPTDSGIQRTNIMQPPKSKDGTAHAAPLFGAACAESYDVKLDGKTVGTFASGTFKTKQSSVFVPKDASKCFGYETMAYGRDGVASGVVTRLAGAAAYAVNRERIDYLMMPAPTSIESDSYATSAYRTSLVEQPCK